MNQYPIATQSSNGGQAFRNKSERRRAALALLSAPLDSIEDAQHRLSVVIPQAVVEGFVAPHQAAQLNKATELWLKCQSFAKDRQRVKELEAMIASLEKASSLRRAG